MLTSSPRKLKKCLKHLNALELVHRGHSLFIYWLNEGTTEEMREDQPREAGDGGNRTGVRAHAHLGEGGDGGPHPRALTSPRRFSVTEIWPLEELPQEKMSSNAKASNSPKNQKSGYFGETSHFSDVSSQTKQVYEQTQHLQRLTCLSHVWLRPGQEAEELTDETQSRKTGIIGVPIVAQWKHI